MFSDSYAYYSSYSSSWLAHAKIYIKQMSNRFQLDSESNVVEVAANDGYLLQYVKEMDIPCYGMPWRPGVFLFPMIFKITLRLKNLLNLKILISL